MIKHVLEDHPEKKLDEVRYGMRVKMNCKSALERQVGEAVSIDIAQRKGYKLLNFEPEYNRFAPHQRGEPQRTPRCNGQREKGREKDE